MTDYNKYYGKGTRNYNRVLVNLINVYRNQGTYKQAAEKSCEAIDLTIKQIRQTFTFLSEREQQKYMAFNGNLVTKFYSLAHQSPDSAFLSRICNLSLLVKGLSLQTGTQLKKGIEDSHDSTATALLDRLNALRASLGAQYQKPLEKQFRVVEMSQEAEDTEKQLMAQSSAFKTAMSGLNANWRTIQAALKPNEAAIEWVAYRYFNKDWTDTTYYAAFVIRPKATAPQFVLACSEKQIIDLLTPTAIKDKANSAIDALYSNKSSLYKTVWQSLEKYLTGCQTLYLSPMGILNRLSFAAIASPNGQPLYARYNLHTMSHLRTLLDQNPTTPFPTTAALFGGIDYETASLPPVLGGIEGGSFNSRFVAKLQTRERSGLGNWEPLPGTLTELNDVAALLKTNKATILKYAGSSASEDNFKALGGQHVALLHVGTHGFVYPADTSKNDNAALTLIANPLLRTGLVLAGAKRNKLDTLAMNASKEDGILTAYETAQINLNGTELVLLSACESGLGDIRGAEGVYGLQRGFKLAGAKKLLMSLWKVNDQTTAQYMKTFYGKWKTTQNLTTAYQQTQTTMRAAYPTRPDVWAAFVLVE